MSFEDEISLFTCHNAGAGIISSLPMHLATVITLFNILVDSLLDR